MEIRITHNKKKMLAFFNLLLYFTLLILCANQSFVVDAKVYNRYDFPFDFIFGASTSAYQVLFFFLYFSNFFSFIIKFNHLMNTF